MPSRGLRRDSIPWLFQLLLVVGILWLEATSLQRLYGHIAFSIACLKLPFDLSNKDTCDRI